MKLKEYFHNHSENFLTDNEKFLLFQKIVEKRESKLFDFSVLDKLFFRRYIYGFFTLFIVFVVFGVNYYSKNIVYNNEGGFYVSNGSLNSVQAGYIANIVYFDGGFFIEHKGKQVQTSLIHDGDIVFLNNDSNLVFHIDDKTKAQISGPAKFLINSQEIDGVKKYSINLLYGDFAEVKSLTDNSMHDLDFITDGIKISQKMSSGPSDFQVKNNSGSILVDNKGGIIHFDSIDDKNIATDIKRNHILTVSENDINLIDDLGNVSQIFVKGDVSHTALLANNDIKNETVYSGDYGDEFVKELLESFSGDHSVKISSSEIENVVGVSLLSDIESRKVLLPEQDKLLSSSFHPNFLENDVKKLFSYQILGDKDGVYNVLSSIDSDLTNLYKTFGLNKTSVDPVSFDLISDSLIYLRDYLDSNYFVPSNYLNNISVLSNWMSDIKLQDFGSVNSGADLVWEQKFSTLSEGFVFR